MKSRKYYIVEHESEIQKVFETEEEARAYAEGRNAAAVDEARANLGYGVDEDLSDKDEFDIGFQAGFDSGVWEVFGITVPDEAVADTDTFELPNGVELEWGDIKEAIMRLRK